MYEYLLPSLLFWFVPDAPEVSVVTNKPESISIRPVEATSVNQYWHTRCQTSTTTSQLPDTINLFPGLPIADIYLEFQEETYFVEQVPSDNLSLSYFEDMKLLNYQQEVEWAEVFYIVAPDETNPGAGKLNLKEQTLNVKTSCGVHYPILAPFKD